MRLAATSSASSASLRALRFGGGDFACAQAQRLRRQRRPCRNCSLSSISAASPRARTSAMMARTDCRDILLVSRLASSSASNCACEIRRARIEPARHVSSLRARAAARGPFAAHIGQPGIDAFDIEPDRAAAGEHQFDRAAGIVAALRRELDRQQRHHRIRRAALYIVRFDRQHAVEMQAGAHAQIRVPARSSSHLKRLNSAAKRRASAARRDPSAAPPHPAAARK